ncbi:CarD family transcriptional regulator [Plastoroseomonas hellenica]|uniref:CarD family transcriptional regulator n=1 Tax=Plastoroseomonas hellenica TaxID=2687306 RepID=UPI001FE6AB7B|nr:CarD family transcriptional regulator [Plastoroseomonas hellenica]
MRTASRGKTGSKSGSKATAKKAATTEAERRKKAAKAKSVTQARKSSPARPKPAKAPAAKPKAAKPKPVAKPVPKAKPKAVKPASKAKAPATKTKAAVKPAPKAKAPALSKPAPKAKAPAPASGAAPPRPPAPGPAKDAATGTSKIAVPSAPPPAVTAAAVPAPKPAPALAASIPRPRPVTTAPEIMSHPSTPERPLIAAAPNQRPGLPPRPATTGAPGGFTPAPKPPARPKEDFKTGDHVVYPTHGVGQVQGIESMEAAGYSLQVIVVTFEENRMTLRVPVNKAASSGLRKLASADNLKEALDTLKGRARIKRTMWSRRAQEYEAKINSGDLVQIAEVVRDLHRNAGQPDQSFSERQIYEQALDRLASEVGAIEKTDKMATIERLQVHLKS